MFINNIRLNVTRYIHAHTSPFASVTSYTLLADGFSSPRLPWPVATRPKNPATSPVRNFTNKWYRPRTVFALCRRRRRRRRRCRCFVLLTTNDRLTNKFSVNWTFRRMDFEMQTRTPARDVLPAPPPPNTHAQPANVPCIGELSV